MSVLSVRVCLYVCIEGVTDYVEVMLPCVLMLGYNRPLQDPIRHK